MAMSWTTEARFPAVTALYPSRRVRTGSGALRVSWLKQPGHETDYPPSHGARELHVYLRFSDVFLMWCLIKYCDSSYFSVLKCKWKRGGLKWQLCLHLGSIIRCQVLFNILPSTSTSSQRALLFRFCDPNSIRMFYLQCVLYALLILLGSIILMNTVLWVVTPCGSERDEVSVEHIASIFRVEEYAKQETWSQLSSSWCLDGREITLTFMMYVCWRGLLAL
jgi:hypothetical protein